MATQPFCCQLQRKNRGAKESISRILTSRTRPNHFSHFFSLSGWHHGTAVFVARHCSRAHKASCRWREAPGPPRAGGGVVLQEGGAS